MVRPQYDYVVDRNLRGPTSVTLRVVHHGGANANDEDRIAAMANAMTNAVVHTVEQIRPNWTRNETLANVRGFLRAANNDNGALSTVSPVIRLRALNTDLFQDMIEQIQQSNGDVQLTDISWSFILIPASFMAGAGVVKKPAWVKNFYYPLTWEPQTFNDVQIPCAVWAVVYAMENPSTRQLSPRRLKIMREKAFNLTSKLGWVGRVSILNLEEFVQDPDYSKYRIVVFTNMTAAGARHRAQGRDFVYNPDDRSNQLYLWLDIEKEHYAAIPADKVQAFYRTAVTRTAHFHDECGEIYYPTRVEGNTCPCEGVNLPPAKKQRTCETCLLHGCKCPKVRQPFDGSRKLVMPDDSTPKEFWKEGDPAPRNTHSSRTPRLWVFDFEAEIQRTSRVCYSNIQRTGDGAEFLFLPDGEPDLYESVYMAHSVNLVVARCVFSNEEKIFYNSPGEPCLVQFMDYMQTINAGNNICIAHNASGYDTRHILDAHLKTGNKVKLDIIARGNKFMKLKLGKVVYIDSMLHLPGSLANLCRGFFPDDTTARKGHFPHLFNTPANMEYTGPIPDLKYFDLAFMVKDDKQLVEFYAWHAAQRASGTPWDFKTELLEYCRQDVLMLRNLVLEYHEICFETFGLSPWFYTTAPSYVHEVVKRQVYKDYDLPLKDFEEYPEMVETTAKTCGWGALKSSEYWFARAALRGGRTDVRKVYHKVSDEDWARGVRIRYQDIVSMYPYVQVARDYPVGLPVINVYDDDCFPCLAKKCKNPRAGDNYIKPNCGCLPEYKMDDPFLDTEGLNTTLAIPPTVEEILADETFFGIVCASLTPPPKLFHPVLVTWDEEAGKCIGSLEPIKYGVFTSVEFKKALQCGYRLDKLHRLDKYKKAPGLWNAFIKKLYIFKMANSESAPSDAAVRHKMVQDYEQDFGMGDAVRDSFPDWAKRGAKRQVFKIMLNSGWGKHCQRANMPSLEIIGTNDYEKADALLSNYSENLIDIKSYDTINEYTVARTITSGENTRPILNEGYLPAGLFVPAYGRLMLHDQLEKLDTRALYHDTDSIVYIYDPEKYNIPESDVWGRWSVEDFDKDNGGIREFVGTGPKSYGLMAENGKNYVKVKGLSLKRAHAPLLNFAVMKSQVLHYLETGTMAAPISVPQFTFAYSLNSPMVTAPMIKLFSFQPALLKGDLVGDTLYPKGYVHE